MSRLFEVLTGVSLFGMATIAIGFGLSNMATITEIKLVQYGARAILVSIGVLLLSAGASLLYDAVFGLDNEWW